MRDQSAALGAAVVDDAVPPLVAALAPIGAVAGVDVVGVEDTFVPVRAASYRPGTTLF